MQTLELAQAALGARLWLAVERHLDDVCERIGRVLLHRSKRASEHLHEHLHPPSTHHLDAVGRVGPARGCDGLGRLALEVGALDVLEERDHGEHALPRRLGQSHLVRRVVGARLVDGHEPLRLRVVVVLQPHHVDQFIHTPHRQEDRRGVEPHPTGVPLVGCNVGSPRGSVEKSLEVRRDIGQLAHGRKLPPPPVHHGRAVAGQAGAVEHWAV
mmetsp:Transcript_15873/g.31309  ORF Transcript_15873/g.31309 Transcript_15873/m.31309 type:complete len:213 (+) Transcript_15873:1064-1702(+)